MFFSSFLIKRSQELCLSRAALLLAMSLALHGTAGISSEVAPASSGGHEASDQLKNYEELAASALAGASWEKAERLYKLCLQESPDTTPPKTKARYLQGLAEAYIRQDRILEAISQYQKALSLFKPHELADDPVVVQLWLDLASCYESLGKVSQAQAIYDRVLRMKTDILTEYGLKNPSRMDKAASFCRRHGKEAKARSFESKKEKAPMTANAGAASGLERIQPDVAGDDSQSGRTDWLPPPSVAATPPSARLEPDGNGASSWSSKLEGQRSAGQLRTENEAGRLFNSAEPTQLNSMFRTLSEVSASQKRYDEAEPLYKKVIRIDEESLGSDHPTLANDLSNLGLLYIAQRRFADAVPLFQRALGIYEKTYGSNNLAVLDCRLNLAQCFEGANQFEQAETLYKQTLTSSQVLLGNDGFLSARVLNNLAFLYYRMHRFSDSLETYQMALSASEKALGNNSRLVGACLQDYARVLRAMKRTDEADKFDARARSILAVAREQ